MPRKDWNNPEETPLPPASIGGLQIVISRGSDDPDSISVQAKVRIKDAVGNVLKVRRVDDLREVLSQTQDDKLMAFIDLVWAKASGLIPPS